MSDEWVSRAGRERGVTPARWLVSLGFVGAITMACGATERKADATNSDTDASSTGGSTSNSTGGDTSSSSTGGGASTGNVDLHAVFEALAADTCKDDCSGEGALFELFYGENCLYIFAGVYEAVQASVERSIDGGAVSFDGSEAQRCLDDVAQTGCEAPISSACRAMFVGHVPEGGACTDTMECAGGGYCNRELGCPGVCEPTLSAGARCDEGGSCAVGHSCSPEGVCELPRANGEPCAASANCLSEYCRNDTDGNVCADAPVNFGTAEGQPCDWVYECQLGLHCEEPVCVPAPTLGEPCREIGAGISCANGAFCEIETGSVEGVCVERVPLGAPCEVSAECATMICDGGTCQEYSRLGEPCVTNERCFGVCDGGVCAPPPECGSGR